MATTTDLNGKANTSHNHSASNITSGTLSVARGGTGVTNISALKNALGITSANYLIQYGLSWSLSVRFPTAFSSTPIVLVQPVYYNNTGGEVMIQCAYDISISGFTSITWTKTGNNWTSAGGREFYWIAIGT